MLSPISTCKNECKGLKTLSSVNKSNILYLINQRYWMLSSLGFCCTHLGPFMCMLRNWYLFQLADALFNTADRGHGPQRVRVQSTEAVLSADLQKGHHSSLLWTTQTDRFNTCIQISINNLMRKNYLQPSVTFECWVHWVFSQYCSHH